MSVTRPFWIILLNLRSVCVAGLFGVYGGIKGLQVSQVQHATTCPFNFSIYFIVLVFSSFKWLQTVAYWKRLTLGRKWYLKENKHPRKRNRTRLTFLMFFTLSPLSAKRVIFYGFKNAYGNKIWVVKCHTLWYSFLIINCSQFGLTTNFCLVVETT